MLLRTRNSAIVRAKQKPRQWGPLSAVRRSVALCCERWGVDPASVRFVHTGWSIGFPAVGTHAATIGSPDVTGLGVYCGPGDGCQYSGALELVSPAVFWHGDVLGLISTSYYNTLIGKYHSSWAAPYYQYAIKLRGSAASWQAEFSFSRSSTAYASAIFGGGYTISGVGENSIFGYRNGYRYAIYRNGVLGDAGTTSGTVYYDGDTPLELGLVANIAQSVPNANTDVAYVFDAVPETLGLRLTEQPYALLQPIPRVTVVDFGSAGGTKIPIFAHHYAQQMRGSA